MYLNSFLLKNIVFIFKVHFLSNLQVDVRWNSYYGMIQRILVLRQAIVEFTTWYVESGASGRAREENEEDNFKNWEFSESDWYDLKVLCSILQPFKNATLTLEVEHLPCAHKAGRILLWLIFVNMVDDGKGQDM